MALNDRFSASKSTFGIGLLPCRRGGIEKQQLPR
jgi:hypothetical protein